MSTEHIIPTPIETDPSYTETRPEGTDNYAVLAIPAEYGDLDEIQETASRMADRFKEGGERNLVGVGALDEAVEDPRAFLEERDATELSPVVGFAAKVARNELGFSVAAQIKVMLNIDNPGNTNNTPHRDGLGSTSGRQVESGQDVKAIRYIYPIGREEGGTVYHPDLEEDGTPVIGGEFAKDADEIDMAVGSKWYEGTFPGPFETGFSQLMPGALLVVDMTDTPWHHASDSKEGGAALVIDVFEHGPEVDIDA